jgi:hypothetical protein
MGLGRASLAAAVLTASFSISVEEALSRIAAARGLPVRDTDEQVTWLKNFVETNNAQKVSPSKRMSS